MIGIGMLITVGSEYLAMKHGHWGRYQYSNKFTPILPGGIPLPVVIAWGVLMLISYWVALVVYKFTLNILGYSLPLESLLIHRLQISLIASLVAVGGDLIMDPVMVKHGHWSWEKGGKWYGIPLTNFIGWFVTCHAAFGVIFVLTDPLAPLRTPFFESTVQWLFAGIYLAVLADITLDAVKMKLSGPALLGIFTLFGVGAMLTVLLIQTQ